MLDTISYIHTGVHVKPPTVQHTLLYMWWSFVPTSKLRTEVLMLTCTSVLCLTHYYTVKEVGQTMNASNICCCRCMTREALLGLAYEAQNFKFLF